MRRAATWFWRLTLICIILSLLTLVLYAYVLPLYVDHAIRAALREHGLEDVSYTLRSFTRHEAMLTDVVILHQGDTWLSIGAVNLRYDWRDLRQGRLRDLHILAPVLHLQLTEKGIDLGPLEHLRQQPTAGADAPFDALRIEAGRLVLYTREADQRRTIADLTIDGSMSYDAQRELSFSLQQPALADGTYTTQDHAKTLRFQAQVLPDLMLTGHLVIDDQAATLRIDRFAHAPSQLAAGQIEASMPLADSAATPPRASLRIDQLAWREHAMGAVHAQVSLIDQVATLTGRIDYANDMTIQLEGRYEDGIAALDLSTDVRDLHRNDPLHQLIGEHASLHVLGQTAVHARLRLVDQQLHADATLDLADATLSVIDQPYTFRGVTGSLNMALAPTMASSPGQRLHWRDATLGQFQFSQGFVRFTLESPSSMLIEHLTARIGTQGRLWVHGVRFDPAAPDISADIFIEALDLEDWLSVVTLEHARGSGRLYGRLPLRLQLHPRPRFAVGEGRLYALGGGNIQLHDRELITDMARQHLPNLDAQGDYGRQIQQRVVQSLQDYNFQELTFVVLEEDGQQVLRVTTRGSGATVDQQLNLTVNFVGFDRWIDFALRWKLRLMQPADQPLQRWIGSPAQEARPR